MKKAIQFLVTAIICGMLNANARTPLKINMPETIAGLSDVQLEMLKGKISDIVLSHSFENTGEFTISPSFTKGEHKVYEGMQNIHDLKVVLRLYIRHVKGMKNISTVMKTLSGEGTSEEEAISNAIESIDANDPVFDGFFEKAANSMKEVQEDEKKKEEGKNGAFIISTKKKPIPPINTSPFSIILYTSIFFFVAVCLMMTLGALKVISVKKWFIKAIIIAVITEMLALSLSVIKDLLLLAH